MNELQASLDTFCSICGADEIVLFEKTTFLVIANSASIQHPDAHRFEKISSIIKQFNLCTRFDKNEITLSYMIAHSIIHYVEKRDILSRWKSKEAILQPFSIPWQKTQAYYWSSRIQALVSFAAILDNGCWCSSRHRFIASAATQVNIAAARRHFEKLEHVEAT